MINPNFKHLFNSLFIIKKFIIKFLLHYSLNFLTIKFILTVFSQRNILSGFIQQYQSSNFHFYIIDTF